MIGRLDYALCLPHYLMLVSPRQPIVEAVA